MIALNHRKGADVIKMGMGNDDRICAVIGYFPIPRNGIRPILLRMHPSIEEDGDPIEIKGVGIPPNFRTEVQGLECVCSHLPRTVIANDPVARFFVVC